MRNVVFLQLAVTVVVAVVAAVIGGSAAAWSALLGGASCVVPNALFAFRLFSGTKKPGGASPVTFFLGEFVKIFLTIAFMGAVVWLYRDLNWLAFLVGVIAVLKSYILLLIRVRS
jgi:ATP synthase protein I